jgi:LmbE family N-acetylglucosaminyl deacetylase
MAVLAHPDDESYGIGGTLARYADEGVDVHVVIATDGAAGSIDEKWQGDRTRLVEARTEELKNAAAILGVTVHQLCYRDSGYIGDPANDHPEAFINADKQESIGRIVHLIRQVRPQVVVTHDETGGYYHPDHIECNKIVTPAFFAAGSPEQYPDDDLPCYQPQRLYYSAFSNRWVRVVIALMRLRGLDPTRAGRNQDIDFTRVGVDPDKLTTVINYSRYWDVKLLASAEHGSQGGGTTFSRLLPRWLMKRLLAQETFIRAYPPAPAGLKETDLFT